MSTKEESNSDPDINIIKKYLKKNKGGIKIQELVSHLQKADTGEQASETLRSFVESLLEKGTALGLLEKKESRYVQFRPRRACGLRRVRRKRCGRRRSKSRRRCSRPRRKRRCCCKRRRRRCRR